VTKRRSLGGRCCREQREQQKEHHTAMPHLSKAGNRPAHYIITLRAGTFIPNELMVLLPCC